MALTDNTSNCAGTRVTDLRERYGSTEPSLPGGSRICQAMTKIYGMKMSDNTVDLTGRVASVTGASRGIGAAVAKAYAQAGAHVILTARTMGALEELDDVIRAAGGKATIMPLNMLDLDKVDVMGPAIAEKFGRLDYHRRGECRDAGFTDAARPCRCQGVAARDGFEREREFSPVAYAGSAVAGIRCGARDHGDKLAGAKPSCLLGFLCGVESGG